MSNYFIIETEDGLTVAEARENETIEQAALRHGGTIDPEALLYPTFDEACDALAVIPIEPTEFESTE